jgi:hypothetical protein
VSSKNAEMLYAQNNNTGSGPSRHEGHPEDDGLMRISNNK